MTKLVYRGVSYDSNSVSVKPPVSKMTGIYRGLRYTISDGVPSTFEPNFNLVYRGVSYTRSSQRLEPITPKIHENRVINASIFSCPQLPANLIYRGFTYLT